MHCKGCGYHNPENKIHCIVCGLNISANKIQLADNQLAPIKPAFCRECGSFINDIHFIFCSKSEVKFITRAARRRRR